MPCSHETNENDSSSLRMTLVFGVFRLFSIPPKAVTIIKVFQLPTLRYCALLHNTCVCQRNEFYFGGTRELRFSYSYEATVAKSQYLRRSGLIPREIICLFSWAGFSLVLSLEICRSRQHHDLSKTAENRGTRLYANSRDEVI